MIDLIKVDSIKLKLTVSRNRLIDSKTGCWLWRRSLDTEGYGLIRVNNKLQKVHRISYEIFIGPIKKLCLHKTICPNRNCFNPEHLYDGSNAQNMQDIQLLNNNYFKNKTHCPKGHLYDAINTKGARFCKQCHERIKKEYRERQKLKKSEI